MEGAEAEAAGGELALNTALRKVVGWAWLSKTDEKEGRKEVQPDVLTGELHQPDVELEDDREDLEAKRVIQPNHREAEVFPCYPGVKSHPRPVWLSG